MYKCIVVGYDGSENADRAVVQAAALAERSGAELHALWVRESLPHYVETIDEVDQESEAATVFFRKLKKRLQAHSSSTGVPIRAECLPGQAARTILAYAEERHCDLIVLGHSGSSGLWGRLLGHTADRVSEHASCDVLIVRRKQPHA